MSGSVESSWNSVSASETRVDSASAGRKLAVEFSCTCESPPMACPPIPPTASQRKRRTMAPTVAFHGTAVRVPWPRFVRVGSA